MEKLLKEKLPGGRFAGVPPMRSRAMGAVKGANNKTTEVLLRLLLVRQGVSGWRLRPREIAGRPDFYFPAERLAVFTDGCFWHGCPDCGHVPKTNTPFWRAKIKRNRERDGQITRALEAKGIMVLRFWEHQLKADAGLIVEKILAARV